MSEKRDYYEVLEIPRTANEEDIKKAFRRQALQYHPDRNREEGATERFKEINEAYQVLIDSESRARYDRFGHQGVNGQAGRGFEGFNDFGGFGDIFESFFGGAAGTRNRRGRDVEFALSVSFRDAIFGTSRETDVMRREVCSRCHGTRGEPGSATKTCPTCNGTGKVRTRPTNPVRQFRADQRMFDVPRRRNQSRTRMYALQRNRSIQQSTQNLHRYSTRSRRWHAHRHAGARRCG